MNFKNLLWTLKSNHTGVLTINRPESLNALNQELMSELKQALTKIDEMPFSQLRVLIITGAGEKAFVAGADIKEMSDLSSEQAQVFAERGQEVQRIFETLRIPVIAAVNGFALGGGCELALACDFIYASENAKFGLPEVSLGLIPGFGGTVRLSRVVGLAKAREMIMTGEMISATEALSLGLVSKVLPKTELLSHAEKTAELIASRGPLAIAAAKSSINQAFDLSIDQGMQLEAENFADLFESQDVREGTKAFVEKRKAQFQGQ